MFSDVCRLEAVFWFIVKQNVVTDVISVISGMPKQQHSIRWCNGGIFNYYILNLSKLLFINIFCIYFLINRLFIRIIFYFVSFIKATDHMYELIKFSEMKWKEQGLSTVCRTEYCLRIFENLYCSNIFFGVLHCYVCHVVICHINKLF